MKKTKFGIGIVCLLLGLSLSMPAKAADYQNGDTVYDS